MVGQCGRVGHRIRVRCLIASVFVGKLIIRGFRHSMYNKLLWLLVAGFNPALQVVVAVVLMVLLLLAVVADHSSTHNL